MIEYNNSFLFINSEEEQLFKARYMNILDYVQVGLETAARWTKNQQVLDELSDSSFDSVRQIVANNNYTPFHILDKLKHDQ